MSIEQINQKPPTKESAKQELREKFDFDDTNGFRQALREGKVEIAKAWLRHIVDNIEKFPQYQKTFDRWKSDRENEIILAENNQIQEAFGRTKEDAQSELIKIFGFGDTKGFRGCLKSGDIETAESWLSYIKNNKDRFPQYLAGWDKWLADRERELSEAR